MRLLLVMFFLAFLGACSGDLGLKEFTFACEKDSDCPAGSTCKPGAGCVANPAADGGGHDGGSADVEIPRDGSRDGGRDGGHDAGRDAGDAAHADIGNDDVGDAGVEEDAGDGGSGEDAGDDTGPGDDAGDAGMTDRGTFVLDWSTIYHAAAGMCASTDYSLTSSTGWVALPHGDSMANGLDPER